MLSTGFEQDFVPSVISDSLCSLGGDPSYWGFDRMVAALKEYENDTASHQMLTGILVAKVMAISVRDMNQAQLITDSMPEQYRMMIEGALHFRTMSISDKFFN